MTNYIITYFGMLATFLLIDFFWLAFAAKKFYQTQLASLLSPSVNWPAAIIFYLLYIIGIIIFAVAPGASQNSINKTLLLSALFGIFCYATYDLSSLATLKNWPLAVVAVDIAWGALLTATVGGVGYLILNHLNK